MSSSIFCRRRVADLGSFLIERFAILFASSPLPVETRASIQICQNMREGKREEREREGRREGICIE